MPSIRASAILIGSICIVHPRSGFFSKWDEPPKWMQWMSYLPGVQPGFINNEGKFVNAQQAHLSAFCSGQLVDESSASGSLTWDQLKW